jgi:hypothetical protein
MRRCHRDPRSVAGSLSFEHLAVVVGVACAGLVGMGSLAGAMDRAIGLRSHGAAQATASTEEVLTRPAHFSPPLAFQAGVVNAARAFFTSVDPLTEIAGEARSARTSKWSRPRFAFGDKNNPIQLSLELEGDAYEIANVYRPRRVKESAWADRDLDEHAAYFEKHGYDHRRTKWTELRLRDDVYYPFQEQLGDDLGRWEVRTAGYVETQDQLFAGATFLRDEIGDGGFHWHVSFKRDPAVEPEVLAYWQHADEHLRLFMIEQDATNVRADYLYPFERDLPARVPGMLDRGVLHTQAKLHAVGLRGGIYGEEGRLGLEIRAVNFDLGKAAQVVESTVRFLEDPKGAKISFSKKVPRYPIGDVTAVVRDKAPAMPTEVLAEIDKLTDWDREPTRRWLEMPFEDLESRPWLAEKADEIVAARERYRAGLLATIRARKFSIDRAGELLHAWASELNLSEMY